MRSRWSINANDIDQEILSLVRNNGCVTINELVNKLSRKFNAPNYLIAYRAWVLWKKGLINLSSFNARTSSVINYVFSLEALWFWVSLVITYMALVFIYINNPIVAYVRYFVGTAFVTFILGYSVVEFAYPRGDEIKPIERFVLSLGLSLVIMPIVGTVLAYMPFRYTTVSVSVTLTLLATVMLVLAAIKKARYVIGLGAWCGE